MQYDRMRIFDIYRHIINIYIYIYICPYIFIYVYNRHFFLVRIYTYTYTSNKHTHLTRHKIHVLTVLHNFKFFFFFRNIFFCSCCVTLCACASAISIVDLISHLLCLLTKQYFISKFSRGTVHATDQLTSLLVSMLLASFTRFKQFLRQKIWMKYVGFTKGEVYDARGLYKKY